MIYLLIEQTGEICHEEITIGEGFQPRVTFSDPAEVIEGSRERAQDGRRTNAKEEDAPDNQDVIEIGDTITYGGNKASEVCHIGDL